jgi:hypothetical protein
MAKAMREKAQKVVLSVTQENGDVHTIERNITSGQINIGDAKIWFGDGTITVEVGRALDPYAYRYGYIESAKQREEANKRVAEQQKRHQRFTIEVKNDG